MYCCTRKEVHKQRFKEVKMKKEEILKRARELVKHLNFDACIEAYNRLPRGNAIIDVVFDRMEELDPERFDKWLNC